MKKILFTLLFTLCFHQSVNSASEQMLNHGTTALWYSPGTYALSPMGAGSGSITMSTAGSITKLYVEMTANPGAGNTWTFTVRVNGSASAVTCAVTGAATTCSDTAHSASVSAGDYVEVATSYSGGAQSNSVRTVTVFQPTTEGETVLASMESQQYADSYLGFNGYGTPGWLNSTYAHKAIPIARAGTIDKLNVALVLAGGAGISHVFTLYKNGSSTALTCTISGASETTCSDTANSVSVSAGDTVAVFRDYSGWPPTESYKRLAVEFTPTTSGEMILGVNTTYPVALSASATQYIHLNNLDYSVSTTSTGNTQLFIASTLKSLFVKLETAPGAGTSRTFTVRNNNSDTALACTISDTATTCNDVEDVSISDYDQVNLSSALSGTPAATKMTASVGAYIAPTGSTRKRMLLLS